MKTLENWPLKSLKAPKVKIKNMLLIWVIDLDGVWRKAENFSSIKDNIVHEEQAHGPGTYTTMRTFGRSKILSLDTHLQRLERENADRTKILNILERFKCFPPCEAELRITVASFKDGYLLIAVERLPEYDLKIEYSCLLLPGQRVDPIIKSTEWITGREQKFVKPDSYEEVILYDPGTFELLEGLSSNVFAEVEGKIIKAAKTKVLKGTISTLVEKACDKLGIEIIENPNILNVNCLSVFSAFFITSTSRLVLPISRIDFDDQIVQIPSKSSQIVRSIQQHIFESLDAEAEYINEPGLS